MARGEKTNQHPFHHDVLARTTTATTRSDSRYPIPYDGTARELYLRGWEFGTPRARGVRVYAAGTRAERVVPATEIHVEARIPPGRGPGPDPGR